MQKIKNTYLGLIVAFLYAPIVVLIAQSFNASRYRGQWTGFTWEWYEKLLESEDIINAFSNTLTIGVTSALLGGNKVLLVGNIIEQEFTAAYDWQLGSALSMVLMVFIILNILLEAFTENGETGKQAKKGARP
jgi:ABC-type spermidine/putrescine transport system permease subunit II